MRNQEPVRTASVTDREAAILTVTLGFVSDPIARWIWPEPQTYMNLMPQFAEAFAGPAFENSSAYIAGDITAASLWLPPGVESDAAEIDRIFARSVRSEIAEEVSALFSQMEHFHPASDDCWYLPMIAVDPAYTGRGAGSALLDYGLSRCDEAGQAAYLEASSPKSIPLYASHGFEAIGEVQVGSSPPMTPMIRKPR